MILPQFFDIALGVWALLASVGLIAMGIKAVDFQRRLRFLKDVAPVINSSDHWPKVSLIVPACNEEKTIAASAASLLAIDYPYLELVLINDRSQDGTGEVMRSLALRDSRVRVIQISELPEGWLGKVHALNAGVKASQGEWLLFSDADIHYKSLSLRKAVAHCVQSKLDFLCVTPSIIARTFPLRVFIYQFLHQGSLSVSLKKIADPSSVDSVGAGAFNLVRRQAYEASPGFEWLRMEVIDDTGLAYMLKKAGAKLDLLSGLDEIELEWYPDLKGFVKGLEKNAFAILQYSPWYLAPMFLATYSFVFGYAVAPFLTSWTWVVWLAASAWIFYFGASAIAVRKLFKVSPSMALTLPISTLAIPFVALRSAWICLKHGGVYWRGTFYPLSELRASQRLKPMDFIFGKKSISR